MAKKQKRKVASNRPEVQPRSEQAVSPVASRSTASSAVSRSSYSQDFNPDYHMVIQDLKKIGILAVTFISLLVVLSFFLR